MMDFPIIEKLGGRVAVFDALHSRNGHPATVDALRMWRARGQIPGDATRDLMALAEELGIRYSASDFIVAATDGAVGPQNFLDQSEDAA